MYGKIHDCIFGSSIMEEDITIRYIWMCMITIADKNGVVDETIPALARRFNVTVNEMIKAVESLQKSDISSRTPEHDGKRLEPIRETFGWRILNYDFYRDMQASQDRKEYMKDYMRVYRKNKSVNNSLNDVSTLADTDTDTDIIYTSKIITKWFNEAWEKYPSKDGKKQALRHYLATVKDEVARDKVLVALKNYATHLAKEGWKKPKNGSTWFNNWEDWVEWREPEIQQDRGVVV